MSVACFVTRGSGFVGQHLLAHLTATGHKTWVLMRNPMIYGSADDLHRSFQALQRHLGHPAGDACLQQIAHLLSSCIRRPRDLLARYGGEEMAVILPETDNDGATVVARLMLERLALQHIPHEGSPFGQVTATIGIACSDGTALDSPPSLIERADQALYIAKQAGRNRLHVDVANV